jgi:hypothetical protein
MLRPAIAICGALFLLACESERERSPSSGNTRRDGSVSRDTGVDATILGDGATLDGSDDDAAITDVFAPDFGPIDASPLDGGFTDGGGFGDAAPPPPPAGEVNLTAIGCSPDFGGEIVVSYNGSYGVGSLRGGFNLVASLQFDLQGQGGTIALGTRHRIDTGLVVNLVIGSTWTNLSQDVDVITGVEPDTISGTLVVNSYDPANGVANIDLLNVRLQNASDLSFCTISGNVTTTRLGR